ncbi:MAG: excinuclease subunit [Actinomycetota bacterium]|jgi:excinuclease ABC subunit C|nr:excinuclease subunit [Actinomycetota bacterium]
MVTSNGVPRPQAGSVPARPGVYLFRDGDGRVVYVGKAKSLRSRLSNYFTGEHHPRTRAMVEAARDVEWIVTDSELEALHLEVSLIKQHRPRYNVRYRDDKSYPYLAITLDEEIPRARVLRGAKRKGVRYYGPFAHAYAIRETLDLLLRTFPVRTCSQGVFDRCRRRNRPCLLFDIERCSGPCVGAVSPQDHRAIVDELCDFLDGNTKPVLKRLQDQMRDAASHQEFEVAAKLRDQLENVSKVIERQQMVSSERDEIDVIGLAEDDLEAAFQVFFIRKGRVTGRKGFIVDKVEDLRPQELVARFLERLYFDTEVPKQVLVPVEPADQALIEEWLCTTRGTKVNIRTPQRGEKRVLLETVNENARQAFAQHKMKRAGDFAARTRQLNELRDVLGMRDAPLRIECFDISNTGGTEAVGSMVVFEDGLPKRSDYRRFAIKWAQGPDDFAMMAEIIRRRFARSIDAADEGQAPRRSRFAYPPNLVVIDGGKGQLGAAVHAMEELGIQGVTTVSLAKRMEEVFVPGQPEPLRIPRTSEALYLLQQVRDEAHRFALTYHRLRRGKRMTASVLDSVPGLGDVRRKKLLKQFGSVKAMREASLADLVAVPGIPKPVVDALYLALHPGLGAQSGREEAVSTRREAS